MPSGNVSCDTHGPSLGKLAIRMRAHVPPLRRPRGWRIILEIGRGSVSIPMIFKSKERRAAGRRIRSAVPSDEESALSPRFARLVRESWWLLVVAAFLYLGADSRDVHEDDPGWSFSGTGAPLVNRGGVAGAWLADLLLYLFGLSAWWWVAAASCWSSPVIAASCGPMHETDHPLGLGVLGFALVLLVQRRAGGDPDVEAAGVAAAGAGRRIGRRARPGAVARDRIQRRDAPAAARSLPSARRCSSACRGSR